MFDDSAPLFQQIADRLSNDIADGVLAEGEKIPSSNEFAAFYRINPATAAKGINVLVDEGLLVKRRGVGMFVADGARAQVLDTRRRDFAERFVVPLIAEAHRIGISLATVNAMVHQHHVQHNSEEVHG